MSALFTWKWIAFFRQINGSIIYIEPQWHGSYLISAGNTVVTAAFFIEGTLSCREL